MLLIIRSKLLTGKNPPDEIKVNDKLKEFSTLISDKHNTIKITIVNIIYTILILKHCFIVSLELKFIKLVNDFLNFYRKYLLKVLLKLKSIILLAIE